MTFKRAWSILALYLTAYPALKVINLVKFTVKTYLFHTRIPMPNPLGNDLKPFITGLPEMRSLVFTLSYLNKHYT